jgi:hypothetical protein
MKPILRMPKERPALPSSRRIGVWGRRTVPVRERVIGLRRRGLSWSQIVAQLNAWRTPSGQGGVRWYPSRARKLAFREDPARCPTCGGPLATPSADTGAGPGGRSASRTVPTWGEPGSAGHVPNPGAAIGSPRALQLDEPSRGLGGYHDAGSGVLVPRQSSIGILLVGVQVGGPSSTECHLEWRLRPWPGQGGVRLQPKGK